MKDNFPDKNDTIVEIMMKHDKRDERFREDLYRLVSRAVYAEKNPDEYVIGVSEALLTLLLILAEREGLEVEGEKHELL